MESSISLTILGSLLLGMSIHVALRLVYGVRGPATGDPLYLVMRITSLLLMGLAFATIFLLVAHVFGLLLAMIAACVAIMVHHRNRQMQRRSLLAVLAASVEKGVPLEPTLAALSKEYPGSVGRHARDIAQLLAQGMSLAESIEQRPGALPELAGVYARAGMQIHAPGQALREAARTQSIQQSLWQGVAGSIFYLSALVVIGISVLTYMMIMIIPAFEAIFQDFGLELPLLTRLLISLSQQVAFVLWPLLLLGLLCALLIAGILQGIEMGWASRLPLFDRLLIRAHSAVVLRILALGAERNRPLEPLFQMMGHSYPNRRIASRVQSVAEDVAQGNDWCECLQQRKLIGPMDLAVLQAAVRVGNLPWALREMADSGLRRLALRIQTVVQMIFPCAILFAGAVVAFIVVSLFLPLVKLISSLA